MPTFVRTDKCDGCKGRDKTACLYIKRREEIMAKQREQMRQGMEKEIDSPE